MDEGYFDMFNRLWVESGLTVTEFAAQVREELDMWRETALALQGDVAADAGD